MHGRIVEEDIRTVSERSDIVKIIGEKVVLRKKGKYFWGLCPFHEEKSPSFKVDPVSQLYYCFGCAKGGNVFTYLKEAYRVDFSEAVEMVAEKIGFNLRREKTNNAAVNDKKRILSANDLTKKFYIKTLNSPAGDRAKKYLTSRGYTEEIINRFELGYAPNNRTALFNFLTEKGFKKEELSKAGLINVYSGMTKDLMINRVIFPINDASGKTVAFGGRTLGDGLPKYLNSPETRIYHKSSILYGLDKAREAIAGDNKIVIVEGYTDLISLHAVGIKNSVATLGTALTRDHLYLLSRYTDSAVLLFDGDSAGLAAAERVLNIGDETVSVSVAILPKGKDPADLAFDKNGAKVLSELIENSVSIVNFCLQRILTNEPLKSMKSKLNAIDKALLILNKINNPILKAESRRFFADKIGVDENLIEARSRSNRGSTQKLNMSVDRSVPPPPLFSGVERAEREMIKILLRNISDTNYLDFLDEEDFTNQNFRDMLLVLKLQQQGNISIDAFEKLSERQKSLAAELITEEVLASDSNKYSFEIYNKIKEFRVERQINSLKSVLQRLNPINETERYNNLFEELIQLEAEKRDLKAIIIGGGN